MTSNFDLKPVESTLIEAIGYDPQTQTLRIKFHSGVCYDYAGVPPELVTRFRAFHSVGGFFHAHIKGAFPTVKLEVPVIPPDEEKPGST